MSDVTQRLTAFWDERYGVGDYVYGREPNDFLVQQAARIVAPGPVLSLADGEGRNSVWLARQGLAVTAVDVSTQGLRKANALAREAGVDLVTVAADLTSFEMGEQQWAAIVSVFLHLPPKARADLHARCLRAMRPGGVFIYEAYGAAQLGLGTGGPKEPELLPRLDDLEAEFSGGHIVHRFEGLREVHEGSLHHGTGHVVQLVVLRT